MSYIKRQKIHVNMTTAFLLHFLFPFLCLLTSGCSQCVDVLMDRCFRIRRHELFQYVFKWERPPASTHLEMWLSHRCQTPHQRYWQRRPVVRYENLWFQHVDALNLKNAVFCQSFQHYSLSLPSHFSFVLGIRRLFPYTMRSSLTRSFLMDNPSLHQAMTCLSCCHSPMLSTFIAIVFISNLSIYNIYRSY